MALSDIAEGLCVTTEQRERGIATVDGTDATLAERLEPYDDELPCGPEAAAAVVERYAAGGSVGDAAAAGELPTVTAAKALHLLGESVSPLGPTGRDIVRDWIAGEVSRSEALALSRATPTEFALAAYVETHEPIDAARDAVQGALDVGGLARQVESSLADATEVPDRLR